ncbi:hypothetical protein MAP00_005131 [Monascus purpureus]|nr:hypothetical protein MAP00_005131 [Monascus purpureus]
MDPHYTSNKRLVIEEMEYPYTSQTPPVPMEHEKSGHADSAVREGEVREAQAELLNRLSSGSPAALSGCRPSKL